MAAFSMRAGPQWTGAAMRAVVLALVCLSQVGAQTCNAGLVKWPSLQCSEPCPIIVARCSLSTKDALPRYLNGSAYCCYCVFMGDVRF